MAVNYTDDEELEQGVVPASGQALYNPDDERYIAPAKYNEIMSVMPATHPATNQLLDAVIKLRLQYKRTETPLPSSLGGNPSTVSPRNNEFHMWEGRLDPTLIYDCGFYTKTEIDERYENDLDFREQLHRSMMRGHITTANGAITQYNFEPVLVMERRQDSDDIAGPCYAIIGGWIYWQIALNTQAEWVEGLAFGNMPDYHVRDVSLRLAGLRSAPLVWELIRQFVHMRHDYKSGEYAIGTDENQPPPGIATANEIVPCSAGYMSKIATVVNHKLAGPIVDGHLLPPATVYPLVAGLKGQETELKKALDQAVAEKWTRSKAETYVEAVRRARRAPQRSAAGQLEVYAMKVCDLLKENDSALLTRIGADQLERVTQLANQLLKEIKAGLS